MPCRRAASLFASVVTATVVAVGCTAVFGGDAKPESDYTLDEVRRNTSDTIYFVGESFAGLPLVAIIGEKEHPSFIYGDCEVGSGFDPGGCPPPLDIQHSPITERHPAMFDPTSGCSRTKVRGVPAAIFESSGGALEIYTGRMTVVIFANRPAQRFRAAEALRPVNAAGDPGDALPPPVRDVESELGRCRPLR